MQRDVPGGGELRYPCDKQHQDCRHVSEVVYIGSPAPDNPHNQHIEERQAAQRVLLNSDIQNYK